MLYTFLIKYMVHVSLCVIVEYILFKIIAYAKKFSEIHGLVAKLSLSGVYVHALHQSNDNFCIF